MSVTYIVSFLASALVAWLLTGGVRRFALRRRIVDDPATAPERKQHAQPIALLGGVGIIVTCVVAWWVLFATNHIPHTPMKYLVGLSIAAVLILIGGWLDDIRPRRPGTQFIWPIMAAVVLMSVGIGITFLTNPFGGLIYLDSLQWDVVTWRNTAYQFTLWADLFTFVWLLGATYTTKILDGLDGLVSGVGVIGSIIVFLVTLRPEVNQPDVALLSLTFGGAALGFLLWNWHPAKIFLGESGSLFIGFMLGTLAIISGGKIATALLILGLPILDLAWVILQRVWRGRSAWQRGDRLHLHFRLRDRGLSVRQSVLILYAYSIVFGLSTLWFHGVQKVAALGGVAILMACLVWWAGRSRGGVA